MIDLRISDLVWQAIQTYPLPGLSLAVAYPGGPPLLEGYGLANIERGDAATANTRYPIGSLTKQFVATAVLMLVQAGQIQIDDPIHAHLEGLPADWKAICVRHLLNHTSGIVDAFRDHINWQADYTDEEIIQTIWEVRLLFPPGTAWHYSNTGYILLGRLLEQQSGISYQQFLEERIFLPLGMTATHWQDADQERQDQAVGYQRTEAGWHRQDRISRTLMQTAAGGLVSTVSDLMQWDAALYTERLLTTPYREQLWRPARLADDRLSYYGFGWKIDHPGGHTMLSHEGHIFGFTSAMARFSEERVTVALLSNQDGVTSLMDLARQIASFYIPGAAKRS